MSRARALAQRPALPVPRHANINEAWVETEACVGTEAEPLHHARPETLEQCVGIACKVEHSVAASLGFQVDRERRAPARENIEPRLDAAWQPQIDRFRSHDADDVSSMSASNVEAIGTGPYGRHPTTRKPSSGPAIFSLAIIIL